MVKQQACMYAVEYTVEEGGRLSPNYAELCGDINESSLNIDPPPSLINTGYGEINEELNNSNITTGLESPIVGNLNDADLINNELENPQIPEIGQEVEIVDNNITNISTENEDLHVSYVRVEYDSDNSSVNEDNNNEGRNKPSPNNTKSRKKRKCSKRWNRNRNKDKRLKGLPNQDPVKKRKRLI